MLEPPDVASQHPSLQKRIKEVCTSDLMVLQAYLHEEDERYDQLKPLVQHSSDLLWCVAVSLDYTLLY